MRKYPFPLILSASAFIMASCAHQDQRKIAGKLDAGLVGPAGEVYIFYKSGSKVVIKQCEDYTDLKLRSDCVQKEGTNERLVESVDFKMHLKNALGVPANYTAEMAKKIKIYKEGNVGDVEGLEQQKVALKASIKKITDFIDAEASADTANLQDLRVKLVAVEEKLGDNAQVSAIITEINTLVDKLVDNIIGESSITKFSVSQSGTSFEYNILRSYMKTPGISMEFASIPAGSFSMGSPSSEKGRYVDEISHQVTLTKGFDLQTTEVTQAQWFAVMGYNNSSYSKSNYCYDFQEINGVGLCPSNPVESVSWNEIQEFTKKLNASQTTYTYRLPTEAEWEYAARGGSSAAYSFGDDVSKLGDYAWYGANSHVNGRHQTHEVAQKGINQFKLYDMHGNVWEWVQDSYAAYPSSAVTNPLNNESGPFRMFRGGSFHDYAENVRSANRNGSNPGNRFNVLGFRLVRTPR